MSEQVNEEPRDAVTSHQADVDTGYDAEGGADQDPSESSGSESSGSESSGSESSGLGLPGNTPSTTSHEADVDAGYDDPDDSPAARGS